jgi:hypothetical protein
VPSSRRCHLGLRGVREGPGLAMRAGWLVSGLLHEVLVSETSSSSLDLILKIRMGPQIDGCVCC